MIFTNSVSVVTSWTVTIANNKNLYRRAKNINKNKELITVNIRLVVTPMGKERTVTGEEKEVRVLLGSWQGCIFDLGGSC